MYRIAAVLLTAPLLAAAGSAPLSASTRDDEASAIKQLLRRQAAALLEHKDDLGASNRRATFSRDFEKLDDGTYRTSFTEETAGKTRLTTERYLVTLGRPSGKQWEVVARELQDTHDELVRGKLGDERFYRFDKARVARDGLVVEATNGSVYLDHLEGNIDSIVLAASDLSFGYEPPDEAPFHVRQRYDFMRFDDPEALDFEPDRVSIACSPADCYTFLVDSFKGLREVRQEELDEDLLEHFTKRNKRILEARQEDGFSGFRAPWDEEREYYSIHVNGKSDEHDAWLHYDNWGSFEIRFGCTGYGTFLGYYKERTRRSVTPAELERRYSGYARDFEVEGIRGTVELALKDAETMTADLSYTIRTRRPLRRLPIFLARLREGASSRKQWKNPSIIIDSIRLEDGPDLTFVKLDSSGGWAILPEEVPADTELKLKIGFENRGAIYKLSPSYSRLARSGWLPLVRFTDMIDTLDLTVKVPAKFQTLGIGKKVEDVVEDGVSKTRWVPASPVNFPTIIFGRYHGDTAGFDATTSDGRRIPVNIYVDKAGMSDWSIRPNQLRPLAQQAANSLNLYREIFQVDYPFHKLDLVNDPMGYLYGQSPASLVYLGSAAFRGGAGSKFKRSLVAHEVGHQWWGSLICNANNRNYWFVESLAEYASALFLEAVSGAKNAEAGRKAYLDHVEDWRASVLASKLYGSVQDARSLSVGGYYAAVYNKGPYAFHILRTTFGDEKLYAFLRKLAKDLAGKEIVTRDIQQVAEASFGTDMEWFFDQWIRGAGLPEYTLSYDVTEAEDGQYVVSGTVSQRVVIQGKKSYEIEGEHFQGVVPLTVTGKQSKQEFTVRLAVEGKQTPFRFRLEERPSRIELNKYGEILARDVIDRGMLR